VELGASANPDLEKELDPLEKTTGSAYDFPGAAWLLLAYAEINGRSAYPRLHRMTRNPHVIAAGIQVDSSIAVSLGLTSYVSSVNEPVNAPPPEGGGCGNGLQALFRPEAGRMFPAPSGL
jgi:hypothetical protein